MDHKDSASRWKTLHLANKGRLGSNPSFCIHCLSYARGKWRIVDSPIDYTGLDRDLTVPQ